MRLFVCALVSLVCAGCGTRAALKIDLPESAEPRFVASPDQAASLSSFIEQVRARMAEARPPQQTALEQVEAADPRLAAALAAAAIDPSPQTFRRVAEEYTRLQITDKAHEYLAQAYVLDARDPATYDARARLWRDGLLLDRALADAYRALYYAPASATVHNTLGTIFQALGRRDEAQRQYRRALDLDPNAAYALNNLCYALILGRQPAEAISACEAALKMSPSLLAARNNLALAHALRGDLAATRTAFEESGDPARALYNLGIVYMAKRQYPDAVSAFVAAQHARPSFRQASERAEQAARLALAGVTDR